jgi:hypothetical protein
MWWKDDEFRGMSPIEKFRHVMLTAMLELEKNSDNITSQDLGISGDLELECFDALLEAELSSKE